MADNTDIDALWKNLIDDPEKIYQDKSIDNETLIKLGKKINPYSYQKEIQPTEEDDTSKVALISYTNLDEDYQRRFIMTSLVGFIYRMFSEYQIEEDERKWNIVDQHDTVNKESDRYAMMTLERMEGYEGNIVKYLREYKNKIEEYNDQKAFIEKLKTDGREVSDAQIADFERTYEKKFYSIRFILNHVMTEMGEDANRRLDAVVKNCGKYDILPQTIDGAQSSLDRIGSAIAEYKSVKAKAELIKNKVLVKDIADEPIPEEDQKELELYEKRLLELTYTSTMLLSNIGNNAKYRKDSTVRMCTKHNDIMEIIHDSGYKPKEKDTIMTIPETFIKEQISKFLDKYFEYNPDIHVRSSFDEEKLSKDSRYDQHDPDRPTMKLLKAKASISDMDVKEILSDRETYNAATYLLNKQPELLKTLAKDPEKYREALTPIRVAHELLEKIPPADTFHRWNYYSEVNMEEIRNVVSTVYHEKPLLDFAIIVYDTIEGTDEEIAAQKKKWVLKHNEELCSDLKVIKMDNWALLGNFKENRKEIDFYNRHTEVLKRIMDKHEDDKKLGKDLMMKRVRKTKEKNIKEAGRDAEIMKEYVTQVQSLADLGAKRALSYEEQKEIDDARHTIANLKEVEDVPEDAIQVNVFTHDTEKDKFVKSNFYTESSLPLSHEEVEEHRKAAGMLPQPGH